MFLLNPTSAWTDRRTTWRFTFHNVSIKPETVPVLIWGIKSFTFHNVSIKPIFPAVCFRHFFQFTFHNVSIKPKVLRGWILAQLKFTFHNVSIKPEESGYMIGVKYNLHSTMFLLNRIVLGSRVEDFTDLQSTMFLLNLNNISAQDEIKFIYIPQCFY